MQVLLGRIQDRNHTFQEICSQIIKVKQAAKVMGSTLDYPVVNCSVLINKRRLWKPSEGNTNEFFHLSLEHLSDCLSSTVVS